jgi:hypothetical protein
MCATCPAHFVLIGFVILTIRAKEIRNVLKGIMNVLSKLIVWYATY